MKTNYGDVVEQYQHYTSDDNLSDPELRLGRMPALKALGDLRGKTVLDFGCGPATNSVRLWEAGARRIIGFDADPIVIKKARQEDPGGDYRVYRGLLTEEVGMVGGILMSFSFCVIPDREVRYILRDMRKLLRRRGVGRLVIIEPNQEKAHGIEYPSLHYHKKEGVKTGDLVEVTLGSGENAILLTDDIYRLHEDYRQLLEEAGFEIEHMKEPLPPDDWGAGGELLRKYPPFVLIVAR